MTQTSFTIDNKLIFCFRLRTYPINRSHSNDRSQPIPTIHNHRYIFLLFCSQLSIFSFGITYKLFYAYNRPILIQTHPLTSTIINRSYRSTYFVVFSVRIYCQQTYMHMHNAPTTFCLRFLRTFTWQIFMPYYNYSTPHNNNRYHQTYKPLFYLHIIKLDRVTR
jgi:hypothetical protein